MANNYTTSQPTTLEFTGDTVAASTVPDAYDIVITPNTGHVVQASDFSIGSTLPIEVTVVNFSNTTTALDPSNQVIARVSLAQWYTMPASADTIEVDIDGTTHAPGVTVKYVSVNETVANATQTFTATAATITTITSGAGLVTKTVSVDTPQNSISSVGKMVIAATAGYHFAVNPTYKLVSSDPSKWSDTISGLLYNSSNQLTGVTFELFYDVSTVSVPLIQGETIIWQVRPPVLTPSLKKIISSVSYEGYKSGDVLPAKNTQLKLNVVGSVGASYNIKIEDNKGLSYDFDSTTFVRGLRLSQTHTIESYQSKLASNYVFAKKNGLGNTHLINVPAFFKGREANYSFKTTVSPADSSTSTVIFADSSGVLQSIKTPHEITLHQFGEVDYNVTVTPSTNGETVATPALKSLTNKIPLLVLSKNNAVGDFVHADDTYVQSLRVNNGYFTTSQALGYSITDTVNGAFSGTTMTMDNDHDAKKVVVGDAVTGTNIADNTTVAAVAVGSNKKVYTLSLTPSAEVADEATITFTRTVGISRQPLTSDFTGNNSINPSLAYTEFDVQQNNLNFDPITNAFVYNESSSFNLFGVESEFSSIKVGALVQGEHIVGYPTVTAISAAGLVSLSTPQALPGGSAVFFSDAGSSLRITEVGVSGAGTTSAKLNVSGYVQKMGISNITTTLTLSNFIETYALPTAGAATATCSLGGTVQIDPRSTCTGKTGVLKISATPSASVERGGVTSAGAAFIDPTGNFIIYNAPDTDGDLQDIVTYKVNDGVNDSAAANITITLTN